jgi:hypothetical protein
MVFASSHERERAERHRSRQGERADDDLSSIKGYFQQTGYIVGIIGLLIPTFASWGPSLCTWLYGEAEPIMNNLKMVVIDQSAAAAPPVISSTSTQSAAGEGTELSQAAKASSSSDEIAPCANGPIWCDPVRRG